MKELNFNGNLLDSTADIIAHQTNCSGSVNYTHLKEGA